MDREDFDTFVYMGMQALYGTVGYVWMRISNWAL